MLDFARTTSKSPKSPRELSSAFLNIRKYLNEIREEIKTSPALETLKETQVSLNNFGVQFRVKNFDFHILNFKFLISNFKFFVLTTNIFYFKISCSEIDMLDLKF